MIDVVAVSLAERGVVFPSTGVGMVVAQPFLDLTPEPFVCTQAS